MNSNDSKTQIIQDKIQHIQQTKINALHFLWFDMNLDWLHCIVQNPKTKSI